MDAGTDRTLHLAPSLFFDGEKLHKNAIVSIKDQVIVDIKFNASKNSYDSTATHELHGILCSGFIDLQVNGGGGIQFNHSPTIESLKKIVEAHRATGTSQILATVITDSTDVMLQAAETVAEAIKAKLPGILGIQFEGPHISEPKKGVHPECQIRRLSDSEKTIYARQDLGIKLITLAPESVCSDDIRWLKQQGCVVSIGHTDAPFESHLLAMAAGATGFTHLYNAMSPLTSREPGAVGAAMYCQDAFAGLILDGHHCDYVAAKLAWRLKNADHQAGVGRLFLVSDAMASTGSDLTEFELFGERVKVENGRLTTSAGRLAGAHLSLQQAVQNAHIELELPIEEALKMATVYPMQFITSSTTNKSVRELAEASKIANLQIGSPADLILLDEKLNLIKRV